MKSLLQLRLAPLALDGSVLVNHPVSSRRQRLSLATVLGATLATAVLMFAAAVPATAAAPPNVAPGTPHSTDVYVSPASKTGGAVAQAVVTVCALTAYSPSKSGTSIFVQAATQCDPNYMSYQTVCTRLVGLDYYGNTGKTTTWYCSAQTSNLNTNKAFTVACTQATDFKFMTQGKVNGGTKDGQAFSASTSSGTVLRSNLC